MTLTLTVLALTANIRRGPSSGASIIGEVTVGKQFEVVNLVDLKYPEQWAKIVDPTHKDVDTFVCVVMPSGKRLCQVSNTPTPTLENDEFKRGWNACLEAIHLNLVSMRK